MNKMIVGILMLVVVASSVAAFGYRTETPKYPVHWMPEYQKAPCSVAVNPFSTKMVTGVIGHRSDGSDVCYVPRQRSFEFLFS